MIKMHRMEQKCFFKGRMVAKNVILFRVIFD